MEAEGDSKATPIDLRRDSQNDAEGQVDAATYVAAKTFGEVALPLRVPFWKAAAIDAQANFAQRLDTAGFTIGGNSGGPVDAKTKQERQKDADEKSLEFASFMLEQSQERESREREEWSRTKSTLGGVTLTGREWSELADRLRSDEDLHRKLLDAFRARGMSDDEANRRYDRVTQMAEIEAIPPSQRTAEQRQYAEEAKADPSFRKDMEDTARSVGKDAVPRSALNSNFTSAVADQPKTAPAAALVVAPSVVLDGPGF